MEAHVPIYHMLQEQTVQWCPVKCKCPMNSLIVGVYSDKQWYIPMKQYVNRWSSYVYQLPLTLTAFLNVA